MEPPTPSPPLRTSERNPLVTELPQEQAPGSLALARYKAPRFPHLTQQPGEAILVRLSNKLFPLPETLPSITPWLTPTQPSHCHSPGTSPGKMTLTHKAKLGPLHPQCYSRLCPAITLWFTLQCYVSQVRLHKSHKSHISCLLLYPLGPAQAGHMLSPPLLN